MSDYYMPPSRDRDRDRERDRERDRDGDDQRSGTGSQGFVKRESTWRPKTQPSRPINAWASRDSPRDSPGPSRKVDAYYEPPKADDRSNTKDKEEDRDKARDEPRKISRSRSRSREPQGRGRDDDRDRERDRDRDSFRPRQTAWSRPKDDERTWDAYNARRRSPARWARDRDRDRDDRGRGDRWRGDRERDDDRRRDASRDRDEPRNRWARSPDTRRSPSPAPVRKRNRSPFRRGGARGSPDYGLGRHDSDSDEPRRRSSPARRSPSSRGRSPSPPSRRRSPSPEKRRRSPSPEKRRLGSPSLPDAKRARENSPPPRRRSPPPRDRSPSRSPSPRRSPYRNGRRDNDRKRARSPDSPPRNRSRWDRDRWQPVQARTQPVKMRQWGRPASPSPSPKHSPQRRRSRSLSRSPTPMRDDIPRPPARPVRDSKVEDSLPYDADVTPERDQPPTASAAGSNGTHPVRATINNWRPAPTGPAAQRNGKAREAGATASPAPVPMPAPRPIEIPKDSAVDAPEVDMDLDESPPPPPKRSDKWSPVKRSSPPRLGLTPSPAVVPSGPSSSQPSLRSGPAAFVPRAPPSGPASIASVSSPARSRGVSGAPSAPSTPRGSETFLHRLADKQQQFDKHLSTIAPYISTAFGQWYAQNATPALHQFLVHHFGRQPTKVELDQIHQLLRMRTQLTRDQQELRHLHAAAVRGEGPTPSGPPPGAPSGPRATRERASQPPTGPASLQGGATSQAMQTTPTPARPTHPTPTPPARPRAVAGEAYERVAQVGEGTYGKVYKARNTGSGALVALKRIRMEQERDGFPVTSMREIKLLQALDHPNIVRLMEMMVSHNSVYMVLEYMNHDLTGILGHPEVVLSEANVKSLNYQMLAGLGYLHARGILHRDMKGSNILLNGAGELKLADFGLARWYHKHKRVDYTNRVITLWYRSPELLMGETAYGPEVDTWSAGCIMLEIFTSKPTFQGQDEISQLDAIWAIMGTPSEKEWPGMSELPWYELVRPREALSGKFDELFGSTLSKGAMEVAKGLLEFDPAKRLLADDALNMSYFTTEAPEMQRPTQLAQCGEHHEMTVKMHRRREGK